MFNAFANLAAAVNGLASVIDVASGRIRLQLAEDAAQQLTHEPPTDEIVDPRRKGAIEPEPAPLTKRGKAKGGAV